jgi:hypothetical protein
MEFTIEYSCPLRARYTEEHLRKWGKLGNIHTRLTTGDMTVPSEEKIRFIENSRAEIERMHVETNICLTCPARLPLELAGEGEAVGCLGRITYPIEAQFEKFIADRIQLALDTINEENQPRLLRILIDSDSPFDGEGSKDLRTVTTLEGLRFFELRLPIRLARKASHITTDNIFDVFAGFTSLDADRTTYSRELPYNALADYYEFLDLILRNELTESEHKRQRERGRNYVQFLRLLAALENAEALQARILLD